MKSKCAISWNEHPREFEVAVSQSHTLSEGLMFKWDHHIAPVSIVLSNLYKEVASRA